MPPPESNANATEAEQLPFVFNDSCSLIAQADLTPKPLLILSVLAVG